MLISVFCAAFINEVYKKVFFLLGYVSGVKCSGLDSVHIADISIVKSSFPNALCTLNFSEVWRDSS